MSCFGPPKDCYTGYLWISRWSCVTLLVLVQTNPQTHETTTFGWNCRCCDADVIITKTFLRQIICVWWLWGAKRCILLLLRCAWFPRQGSSLAWNNLSLSIGQAAFT